MNHPGFHILVFAMRGKANLVIVNYYNNIFLPSRTNMVCDLEAELANIIDSSSKPVDWIMAGDFNCQLCNLENWHVCGVTSILGNDMSHFKYSPYGDELNLFLMKYNLVWANEGNAAVRHPTFVGRQCVYLIDFVFV